MRSIAIYGKGGIGKSTIASHIAAVWALQGYQVMLIGCDPKADSTRLITGKKIPSIIDHYEEILNNIDDKIEANILDGYLFCGFSGIKCVETGGPKPGVGCAGIGFSLSLELIRRAGVLEKMDFVIYDILGDVVCGGFAVPMRLGYANEIYIVTSGEYASLYAANNITKGVRNMSIKLGGIIGNCRGLRDEDKQIKAFAQAIGINVVGIVPHSSNFPTSELLRKTLIQLAPTEKEGKILFELAKSIQENKNLNDAKPFEEDELENWFINFFEPDPQNIE